MTAPTCPSCRAQQADWLLCARCTRILQADLRDLPEWMRYVDDTMARDVQAGNGGGSKSRETPLPYDERASKARAYVRNQLATWAMEIGGEAKITDNPRAWCNYLLARIDVIRGHEAVEELAQEIHYCLEIAQKAVDSPPSRVYLGPCQGRVNEDGEVDDERAPCATQLYAKEGEQTYECPVCHVVVDVKQRRSEMLGLVEHQRGTIATCVHVLEMLGVHVKPDTARSWTKERVTDAGTVIPQRLFEKGVDSSGSKVYRVGDVLAEHQRVHSGKRARRAS